ncbi:hypothetical protein LOTGIDRAFT_205234 [Lottia gigantea]|uniref:Basal body-orientation factor 1 n=1 Tax=Lottia gigantea TaxID=225164 RepID=V4ARC9_LOTGI|nr:hypothetical protein LOTGIDRAFT_205234 [Lottia gigantea]ESO99812.1 hypothetical protein LOTGIDRAFT_205234 [Lottia gigantea]
MPKKVKKGKGKGKKGKKGGKKSKKQESVLAIAAANSKVWEARVGILENSRNDYRDNAHRLVQENDALTTQMLQTEKDTIDVITYLKQQEAEKDSSLEKEKLQNRELKKQHRQEKEVLVDDFTKQISELEDKLGEKMREIDLIQGELKMVKEFRRKRAQMQKDLDDIKEAMHNATRNHKDNISRMERKFFEEKMRLQQEANKKIAELAEKAHSEAISNLDESTKNVYKENVRLSEALNYHMKESDLLKKERAELLKENEDLKGKKEINDLMVQEKIVQNKQQKEQLKEQEEKIETLEKSLSHVVREFESEKKRLEADLETQTAAAKIELTKLQRVVEMKSREMSKVKKLAKSILDQRTELERFFLDALEEVKVEISANQAQYRRDAQSAYQLKMFNAVSGKADYPKVRTFNKCDASTNSVFKDLEAAQLLHNMSSKIDITDLTWEQRERVLRYLFAKMNGDSTMKIAKISSEGHQLSITQGNGNVSAPDDTTFLTQVNVEFPQELNKHPVIPEIGKSQATKLLETQS